MPQPVAVDGRIAAAEWGMAAKTCGFMDTKGRLVTDAVGLAWIGTDRQSLFVALRTGTAGEEPGTGTVAKVKDRDGPVWDDDAVEILASPDQGETVYHVIVNSVGAVYDSVHRGKGGQDKAWNCGIRSASRVESHLWDIEIAIPLADLGSPKESLKLNVCRDWREHGPASLTGAASFADPATLFEVRWGDGVPVVRLHGLGNLGIGRVNADLELGDGAKGDVKVIGVLRKALTYAPSGTGVLQRFSQPASSGWRGAFAAKAPPGAKYQLGLAAIDGAGAVLQSRLIGFEVGGKRRRNQRPVTASTLLDEHTWVYARHYPGFQRLAVEVEPFDFRQGKLEGIEIVAHGPAGEERRGRAVKRDDGVWKALLELKSGAPGAWQADVVFRGPAESVLLNKKGAFSFERKQWPWENNTLGVSDEVIPPFTPLRVEGAVVHSVLRGHQVNGLGLWGQVNTLGRDILAAPMGLECRVDGTPQTWRTQPVRFTETAPHRVVARSEATAGGLTWRAVSTFDYDGFMWVKATLSATAATNVDRLTLRIPLTAAECTLMHACADRIRKNKAGLIPGGEGEVWNSADIDRYLLYGERIEPTEIVPYLWLGGEERGLCWLADNSRGFALRDKAAAVRVLRPGPGQVVAEIDLINQPTAVHGQRSLAFGLQATPVKPRPKDWRNWHFGVGSYIPGMLNVSFGVHCLGAAQLIGAWKRPFDHDWTYLEYLRRAARTKKEDLELVSRWVARTAPAHREWTARNRESMARSYTKFLRKGETLEGMWARWLELYMRKWSSNASRSDLLIPYTDPRLQIVDAPETQYYAAEWWGPQLISYAGVMRTFPTPSCVNFMIHCYKEMLEHAFDGIYLDDTFMLPGNNPDNGTAVLSEGRTLPHMGMLAMRGLVKRLATVQHQLGMNPRLIVVHTSNAFLIPVLSFADISYDWEMGYGEDDFQDRFALDFIRTESTGLQAGLVPTVLGGVVKKSDISWTDWLKVKKKRLTRTSLALTLLHEIRINHQPSAISGDLLYQTYRLLHRFDIANADCEFVPYWRPDPAVSVTGGDLKLSFYKRPDRLLLVVSNMGEQAGAVLQVDRKRLGLPEQAVLVDAESATTLAEARIDVPRHDFRLVYVGAADAGKALNAPDVKPGD